MDLKIFLESGFFLGMLVNALLFVPQALTLYRLKEAKSVSLITFLGFNIIQAFTAIHAYLVSDYLLLIGSILAFITCGTVTFLAILYR
jgi:MtN3 and saliva related transmembrane protein